MKDYILTYSGVYIDPLNMQPGDVRIEDIAHSLAMMVRANGHCKSFYSVAQHSVNCALEAQSRGLPSRVRLGCLLQDAAEAYIADIPRPVKKRIEGFARIEERVSDAVFAAYGLQDFSQPERDFVAEIDDALLYGEFEALMDVCISPSRPYFAMAHDYSQKPIEDVEHHFLALFQQWSASF